MSQTIKAALRLSPVLFRYSSMESRLWPNLATTLPYIRLNCSQMLNLFLPVYLCKMAHPRTIHLSSRPCSDISD